MTPPRVNSKRTVVFCAIDNFLRIIAHRKIINSQCTKMASCFDSEYYERLGVGFQNFLTSSGQGKSLASGRKDEGEVHLSHLQVQRSNQEPHPAPDRPITRNRY